MNPALGNSSRNATSSHLPQTYEEFAAWKSLPLSRNDRFSIIARELSLSLSSIATHDTEDSDITNYTGTSTLGRESTPSDVSTSTVLGGEDTLPEPFHSSPSPSPPPLPLPSLPSAASNIRPEPSISIPLTLFARVTGTMDTITKGLGVASNDIRQLRQAITSPQVCREPTLVDTTKTKAKKGNLEADVREYARFLMRRKNSRDSFCAELLPTEDEVKSYDPHQGECCTVTNFRPDLRQKPRSVYNQSVARVFAQGFKGYQKYSPRDTATLEHSFIVHLRSLQQKFRAGINQEAARIHRRNGRRRDLFNARMMAAREHSPETAEMLARLGKDSMSTDESSSDEDGGKRYRVRVKPWRSAPASRWLKRLDSQRTAKGGPGQSKRYRAISRRVSHRPPPKGLPHSAYDAKWLAAVSDYTRKSLEIDEEEDYDYRDLD